MAKKSKIERSKLIDAIDLIQEAIKEKYGAGSGAQVYITAESVSLDDPDCAIVIDNGTVEELADELIIDKR